MDSEYILLKISNQSVERRFNRSFIFLDLLITIIWITLSLYYKEYKAILLGIIAFCIYFSVDNFIWLKWRKTRTIKGVKHNALFLLYFSFTYGMNETLYVIFMFKYGLNTQLILSACLFGGWLLIGLLQKRYTSEKIITIREMGNSRKYQIFLLLIVYIITIIISFEVEKVPKMEWNIILKLYFIGVLTHFAMESTLMISKIRPINYRVLLFNSLVEFAMFPPFLYVLYYIF